MWVHDSAAIPAAAVGDIPRTGLQLDDADRICQWQGPAGSQDLFFSARQEKSSGLGDATSFDRSQINVEQRLVLLALLLVLLTQPDDFSKHLHVEAVALGFQENLLLGFVEFSDLRLDVLDAFDDGSQLITRNLDRPTHGLLLLKRTHQN
jgi:hypothetical protein